MRMALFTALAAFAIALAAPVEPAEAGGVVVHYRVCDDGLGTDLSGTGEGR